MEPRVMALLDEAQTLAAKVARGKRMTKTRKVIGGVPLRLAHAGSSTALKSDPAALALVDEYDELLANVKGQGDPLGLVMARGDTVQDYTVGVTSTPSNGRIEVERDEASGLEFWAAAEEDDVSSPIWRLWQAGTRHHWCWPCPQCARYFVPRFKQLRYPEGATPSQARRSAFLECPRPDCGGVIEEAHKADMNARGVFVAPGQTVTCEGIVEGEAEESSTVSFWVSGLASPFVTFGQRAERYLTALATGESAKIQTAINAGFGEVYAPGGGDVPEWQEVQALASPYPAMSVPRGVILLTAGVDVQGNRLVYVVRGWGARASSWLVTHGDLWGKTSEEEVWARLSELLRQTYDGLPIKFAFVDSGFRPGKKVLLPLNRVYDFCRRHRTFVFASKGSSKPMVKPLVMSSIEVEQDGRSDAYGLELVRLDPGYWKGFVQERIRWPEDQPGAFRLHEDIDEAYCKAIVSEAPIRKPSGGVIWQVLNRENHLLDAEAMAAAAAYLAGVQNLTAEERRVEPQAKIIPPHVAAQAKPTTPKGIGAFAARLNR